MTTADSVAARLGVLGSPPTAELSRRDWDHVVVGAGHNGLAAAAYLARSGASVLVVERRERVGGACTLERPFPDQGFTISPCAYVVGLLDKLVIDELGLRSRGLRMRLADPELFIPFEDGTAFTQWLDPARTEGGLRDLGVSEADIRGFHDYNSLFERARAALREGERDLWVGDSPPRAEVEEALGDPDLVHLVFEASIGEVLDSCIGDTRIKDALAPQGLIAAYGGPRAAGTAWIHLMHHMGDQEGSGGSWAYVEGGIGMVSFTLAEAALEAGATIACGLEVGAIVPGQGVELEDGTPLRARNVICNADPKRALSMLAGSAVPDAYRQRLEAWKVRSPTMKLNAALSALPEWPAAGGGTWPATGTINVTDGVEKCEAAFAACTQGRLEIGFCELYCQTATDPSPAPPGKHLMSAFCQYAPYEPAAGPWDDAAREQAADAVIAMIERFAPGFGGLVEHRELLAPPDIERKVGLTGGQIFQGECFPDQMWDRRLSARTPVEGLYFCGAATHPGGSVIGLNGRNAALAVLADSG